MSSWGIRSVPESEDRESFKEMTSGLEAEDGSLKPGQHKISCGTCPRACSLLVIVDDERKILSVTGNRCRRGVSYVRGLQEGIDGVFHASVRVRGGMEEKCPVVTTRPLDKNLFMRAQVLLRRFTLTAPVSEGDLVMEDLLGTGISVIAAKNVGKQQI